MQYTATFPTDFSHIIQNLETLALRCTTQLLSVSEDVAGFDADLFGKLQRNLAGILRSLALVEKRNTTAFNTTTPPSRNAADSADETENPVPHKTTPDNAALGSSTKVSKPSPGQAGKASQVVAEKPPALEESPAKTRPKRRPSKSERRLLKRARKAKLKPRRCPPG